MSLVPDERGLALARLALQSSPVLSCAVRYLGGVGVFSGYCRWLTILVPCMTLPLVGHISPADAQQAAQPQFTSAGIRVVINRATAPNRQGEFVVSLVLTNMGEAGAEIFLMGDPQALTDRGGRYEARGTVSGLPVCYHGGSLVGMCAQDGAVLIDANSSITVTLGFRGPAISGVCSIDFSMPAYMRRIGGRTPEPWRAITIGLPNVRVC